MKSSLWFGLCLSISGLAEGATPSMIPPAARILQLEDERSLGDGELEQLLRSGEPETRLLAIRAAGRIGDGAATPAVVAALTDPSPEIRREAAFALGEMEDGAAYDGLVGALSDVDRETRLLAIEALGKLRDPRAEPVLRALLADEGKDSGEQGAVVLQIWRFRAPESLSIVRGLLKSPDVGLRRRAAYCLMRAGAETAVSDLIAALADADSTVRSLAGRALGNGADATAVPALLELLARSGDGPASESGSPAPESGSPAPEESSYLNTATPGWQVRVNVVRSLGRLKDPRALLALESHVDDPSGDVRVAAIEALAEIGAAEAAPAVARAMQATASHIREAALDALVAINADEATRAVIASVEDNSWVVQAARVRAMGKLGLGERFLSELERGFDSRVTPDIIGAMVELELPDLEPRIHAYLRAGDAVVRSVAADRWTGLEVSPRRLTALLEAWAVSRHDTIVDAKVSILSALAPKLGEFAVRMVFFEALKDRERLVRHRAVELLRNAGMRGESLTVGATEAGRSADFYTEVLAWAALARPQAIIETARGSVRIELFPRAAPLTVYNFVKLATASYYDGLEFHRVVPGFVAQGGCPRGDGWGGPGYAVRCEINSLRFTRGAVGMALAGKDSGGSQFFFVKSDQPHLDGGYTVFGRVVEGMTAVDSLLQGDVIRSIAVSGVGALPPERVAASSPLASFGRNVEPAAPAAPPRSAGRDRTAAVKGKADSAGEPAVTAAPPPAREEGPEEAMEPRRIIRPDSLGSLSPVVQRPPPSAEEKRRKAAAAKARRDRRRADDYSPK